MKNWIGQDINVGDVVYRGARDGNTSSFKIGRVEKVNETKRLITIWWIVEQGVSYEDKTYDNIPKAVKGWGYNTKTQRSYYHKSHGTCSIDVVVKIENDPIVMGLVGKFETELSQLPNR